MPRPNARPPVQSLPPGTVVNNLKILAHLPEFNEVEVRCEKCFLKKVLPYKNFYARDACGCTSRQVKDPFAPTSSERETLNLICDRWKAEQERYIPTHLQHLWKHRQISPRWHPDNPDRYRNFVEDVGHKTKGQSYGLLDPCGDFVPENFYWKNDRKDHQGQDRKTGRARRVSTDRGKGESPGEIGEIDQKQKGLTE